MDRYGGFDTYLCPHALHYFSRILYFCCDQLQIFHHAVKEAFLHSLALVAKPLA
jgi:hypothetical protein